MKFEILKEESFNLDFIKNVLKNTNNPHRDKYLEVFNSEGLTTNKYEFHDLWEDFAEFILSKDFELYKINRDIGDPHSEKTQELLSKHCHKSDMILCDILKRKYEFERNPMRIFSRIEKDGVQYYSIPFKGYLFMLPKNEVDISEAGKKMAQANLNAKKWGLPQTISNLGHSPFLELLLTPAEKDEYKKECKQIQEGVEHHIQIVENICGLYKAAFAKSNLTLSDDELQFLKEIITNQTPTLDFLGITKPNSSFSKPLYFIEVKSSKSGYARASPVQKKFIEKAKEKFGMLVFLIEIKPNEVRVKFFSPK